MSEPPGASIRNGSRSTYSKEVCTVPGASNSYRRDKASGRTFHPPRTYFTAKTATPSSAFVDQTSSSGRVHVPSLYNHKLRSWYLSISSTSEQLLFVNRVVSLTLRLRTSWQSRRSYTASIDRLLCHVHKWLHQLKSDGDLDRVISLVCGTSQLRPQDTCI